MVMFHSYVELAEGIYLPLGRPKRAKPSKPKRMMFQLLRRSVGERTRTGEGGSILGGSPMHWSMFVRLPSGKLT